jgi:hypothetical protein
MAVDKETLKKMFPNLYRELQESENKISINSVRKDADQAEEAVSTKREEEEFIPSTDISDKLRNFNPSAVDFIRRCDNEAQAEEIIAYLQKKGEITGECAEQLRCQLNRDGVRSFGSKKEENHYFREGGIC